MKARIVIGANYGDEGKGTVVANYTKNSENILNVLTNGGAQRGHSILTKDGNITNQHFGSGTYFGADSYYSRFFILNPMQFVKEYDMLIVKPKNIYRDSSCMWSTPYDSIVNLIEQQRKGNHASCCMGIWNTIKRYRDLSNIPTFDDFVNNYKISFLSKVKAYYDRIIDIPEKWKDIWNSLQLQLHFMNDCKQMQELTTVCDLSSLLYNELIFENGQGLLLCDTGKDTYDTTPSQTGIIDSLILLKDLDVDDITAHYVTRPYLTRHGDGFINELNRNDISSTILEDRTNHYNEFQGNFRYGKLNISDLKDRIINDCQGIKFELELTHCDEMDRVDEFTNIFDKVNIYDNPLII